MKRPSLGVFPPFKSHPFHSAEELQIVSEEVRPEVTARDGRRDVPPEKINGSWFIREIIPSHGRTIQVSEIL